MISANCAIHCPENELAREAHRFMRIFKDGELV